MNTNEIQIETVIARIIELYNKAKKEGKENPVQWATYKTSEWVHRKHPGGKVEYKKETTDNPCEDCDRDCGMCGLTLENDWL